MKLYMISNMYPSTHNPGYGVFVKNITIGLEDEGIHTIYCSVIKGRGNNIIEKFWKYISFYWSILITFFRHYDLIYVHFPTYSAPILWILMHITKKRMIVNFHGEDLLYQEESILQQYLGRISDKLTKKYASLIVVPSNYYKNIVLRRGLASENNVYVSPSGGINETIFNAPVEYVKHDYCHLGFVGRMEENKGILEFIDACVSLSKKMPIKATIIGYGPLIEVVKEKIKPFGFMTVISGVPQSELPNYYHDFDLFCFPSKRKSESLGLVGIEAMACGTPVVGSAIGGILTYLKDGENGFTIRLSNLVEDIVDKAYFFYNIDSKIKDNMRKKCISTASNYYQGVVCQLLANRVKSIYKR